MLHEGNTLVLGGSVDSLVDIQRKALVDARKEAGVGVDPTVRALIWNPDTGEDQGMVLPVFFSFFFFLLCLMLLQKTKQNSNFLFPLFSIANAHDHFLFFCNNC